MNVGIAGQLGVEWNFPAVPLQLSLDWRPVFFFLNNRGFGYDSVFMSDDLGVTFGEASAAAKDGVSHRGRSLEAFSRVLGEVFGGIK